MSQPVVKDLSPRVAWKVRVNPVELAGLPPHPAAPGLILTHSAATSSARRCAGAPVRDAATGLSLPSMVMLALRSATGPSMTSSAVLAGLTVPQTWTEMAVSPDGSCSAWA